MTMNKFHQIGEEGKCPSCYGNNIRRISQNNGGADVYTCDDCSGYPALCNHNDRGVVYISHNINFCPICGEKRPHMNTHMLILG